MTNQNTGASRIFNERMGQIVREGYLPSGDHGRVQELFDAAFCYFLFAVLTNAKKLTPEQAMAADAFAGVPTGGAPEEWPWAPQDWKPTGDVVTDLTKAGALIAAAIDAYEERGDDEMGL